MNHSENKAVIFDMDGVLTDSEPLINEASVLMFQELGVNVQPEDFYPFVGTGEKQYIGGVEPKHCVVIEDAEHGVQAAKSAGMRCVAVMHTFEEDKLSLADLIKPHIQQIELRELFPEG